MSNRRLQSGYAYKLLPGAKKARWRYAKDDLWDTEVVTPTGHEKYLGTRTIDGAQCSVFDCGADGICAQMEHMTRVNALKSRPVNSQGLTFEEWANAAGWGETVRQLKLTGQGYEDPEISWQMGEDPTEHRAEQQRSAESLDKFLRRGRYNAMANVEMAMPSSGPSTTTIALGVGALALIGAAGYYIYQSEKK